MGCASSKSLKVIKDQLNDIEKKLISNEINNQKEYDDYKLEKKASRVIPLNIEIKECNSYLPNIHKVRVIKVYDGDTITVVSYIDDILYKFSVRLKGVDCPELKSKNKEENEIACLVRNNLSKLILNDIVELTNIESEKYGRLLCDVYHNKLHINKWLLDNNYAVVYEGKTKKSPECWKTYYQLKNVC